MLALASARGGAGRADESVLEYAGAARSASTISWADAMKPRARRGATVPPRGSGARIIGRVVAEHPSAVVQTSRIGGRRVLAMLTGEQLPRIC